MRYELQCKKCKVKLNLLRETETKDEYEQDKYGNYTHIDCDSFSKIYLYCPRCGKKEEIKDTDSFYIQPIEVIKLFAKSYDDNTLSCGTEIDSKLLEELMNEQDSE